MAMLKALIRRFWKPLLACCATCALGIAVMTGLSGGCLSIETSTYGYLDAYRYYDAYVSTAISADEQLERLACVDGVAHAEARMVANTAMLSPSGRHLSIRALTYAPEDWQRFVVWESFDAGENDAVSLELGFARDNGISAGDEVQIQVDGTYRTYIVESLVSCPETLSVRAYDNVSSLNSDFGYVYVPIALVEKEPNTEREEAQAELKQREDELGEAKADAKQAYDQALDELETAQDELARKMGEAQTALEKAAATGEELDSKERDARAALDNLANMESSLKDKREGLVSKRKQLVTTKAELEDSIARLEEAQQKLAQVDESLGRARSARDAIAGGDAAAAAQLLGALDPSTRLDGSGEDEQPSVPDESLIQSVELLSPYAGGASTVGELLAAYNQALAHATAAVGELEAGRSAIVDQLAGYGVSEGGIGAAVQQQRSGIAEAEEGVRQLDSATGQIDANLAGLDKKRQELHEALDQIAAARVELRNAQQQAQEGKEKLDDLQKQLEDKRKETKKQWAQSVSEFSNLGDELQKAEEELGEWKGYQAFHDQYLLWFEDDADPRATLKAAEAALAPTEIKSSSVFEDSSVKSRLDNNFVPLRTLSYFVPAVFFSVVLLVIFLFVSLIVRHSRREIGILRALGKSTTQVRSIFCVLSLLVTICAVPLGVAIGYGVMRYVSGYFSDFFNLPEHVNLFDNKMLAISIVLSILVVQLATLVGTSLVSTVEPSEAISRTLPAATNIPGVVQRLTSSMDELSKFSVLSLLRNPVRLCFSVVCMAASVAIILAAQSFVTSKNHLVDEEFGRHLRYDCQLFLTDKPSDDLLNLLKGLDYVSDVEVVGFYSSKVSNGSLSESANVNAIEPGSDLVGIYDSKGQKLEVPEQGIVLEEHLAKNLDAHVGSTVFVDGVPFEVQALSYQSMNRVQYVPLNQAQELGSGDLGCVIFKIAHDNQQRLLAKLTGRDDYVFAVFTDVLYDSNMRLFATYDLSAWLLTSFAVLIGALVVFNVAQTNLIERKRELCVLRTLGFSGRRLSFAMFMQTLIQFGLALMLGLPLGKLIAVQAFLRISTPDRSYDYVNGPREYLIAAAIVFAYATVSHMLAMRSMGRWDINEGVRDKE